MSNFMMLEREYLPLCIIFCYFKEHSTNVTIQEKEFFCSQQQQALIVCIIHTHITRPCHWIWVEIIYGLGEN
jgi:hypothetical protein